MHIKLSQTEQKYDNPYNPIREVSVIKLMKLIGNMLLLAGPFALLAAGCAQRPYGMGGGNWGHMMNYGPGGIFMWLLIILVVAVVVYFIFARSRSDSLPPSRQDTPLDILKKRHAKGEITREEFEQLKKDLED
ncbi:MAG: SHOCT domain-containing protein [Desulfobacterales bacterium]|nr:SHOCT domain-containing protein [Desulfobacterales bacterium]